MSRAATRSASTFASTSGRGGSSRSAWRTTSSRAPPARRSSPSISSTGCRRPRASSSGRWPPRPRTPMTVARVSPVPGSPTVLPPVERRGVIPLGFRAGGLAAGIKASGRPDLAVAVTTSVPAAAAAVFTPNAFAAAPVRLSKAHLAATSGDPRGGFGWAEAVISTSGSANAATGLAAIMPTLEATDAGLEAAAIALRTTDSVTKLATTTVELPDADGRPVTVTVSGIAKGVGMIHPNMATMLSIVLTDAAADPETLWSLLRPAAARTWDQLSVDGDTSTNDTVFVLASGQSGAAPVRPGSSEAAVLGAAIEAIGRDLARQQAADGEGAATLITAVVTGAADDADARAVARAVVSSSLVKASAHGRDPNWGRVAGAAGNARLADAAVLEAAGLAH